MGSLSIGIDLGTTNSCLAVLRGPHPAVVPGPDGSTTMPSVVAVRPNEIVVGAEARRFLLTDPTATFVSIKRRMGQRYVRSVHGN